MKLEEIQISENISINIISIDEISTFLGNCIDKYIYEVCFGLEELGYSDNEKLNICYKRLIESLDKKINNKKNLSTLYMGKVSEFLLNIFFHIMEFKQASLYFSLEGKGMAKGFDGVYYDKNNELIIMESKSSEHKVEFNHFKQINIAVRDLINKFGLKDNAQQWDNALKSYYSYNAGNELEADILKEMKKLKRDELDEIPRDLSDHNVAPCGTIFLSDISCDTYLDEIYLEKLKNKITKKYKGIIKNKKMICFCVTMKSINVLKDYLIKKQRTVGENDEL